jgi:hypothetical protein
MERREKKIIGEFKSIIGRGRNKKRKREELERKSRMVIE